MDTTLSENPQPIGIDRDASRRPGVPRERPPTPWPNTRYPPARMQGDPSSLMHGRRGKPLPPVFGTHVPPRGLSGLIRRAAHRHPDHEMRHWTMLLLADRVDAFGTRSWRILRVAVPLAAVTLLAARALRDR